MRKLFILLSLVVLVAISGTVVAAARPTNVSVTITSSFDNDNKNLSHSVTSLPVGNSFQLNASNINSMYTFAFWVINGVVRDDLEATDSIKLQTSMHIQAVFYKSGEHAVLFVDSNGKLISTQYVANGGSVTAPSYAGLSKPGLEVNAVTPWKSLEGATTFDSINSSRVYVLQYTATVLPITLSITGGVATPANPNRNDVVTLVASDLPNFKYWKDQNGNVLSYNSTFVFTAIKDVTIVAETVTVKTPETLVTMSDDLAIREGYETYVGRFELESGHALVEWGFILSQDSVGLLSFNTENRIVAKSNNYNSTTNEFTMSFSRVTFARIRAYVIVDNGTNLVEYYSYAENLVAPDLFISEYIEGSSNNKAIEIFNGTGRDIDLSGYSVKTYSNGSSTPNYNLNLTGTLIHGEVYVIYNAGSNANIISAGDISSDVTFYNGDDAVGLYNGSELIDLIGVIGVDPGASWPVGTGSTVEYTLVRKSSVLSYSGEFVGSEWDVYPQDTFTYLGSHTATMGTLTDAQKIVLDTSTIIISSTVKVAGDMNLPVSGSNGAIISWSSDSTHLISDLGIVTLPSGSPENVVLTATITLGSLTKVKAFEVAVGKTDAERVSYDKTSLSISTLVTEAGSMGLPTSGSEGSTITWSSNNTNVISDNGVVVLPESGSELVNLTANISFGTSSDTKVFAITVNSSSIVNYDVVFNSNGGSSVSTQSVQSGEKAVIPTSPTKLDYIFIGWFSDVDLLNLYDFNSSVNQNTTLHAKWALQQVLFRNLVGTTGTAPSGWLYTGLGSAYADGSLKMDSSNDSITTEIFNLAKSATIILDYKGNTYSGGSIAFYDQNDNLLHTATNLNANTRGEISFSISTSVTRVKFVYTKVTGNIGIYDVTITLNP